MNQDKMLSQNAAESILSMITVEKRFSTGDRLQMCIRDSLIRFPSDIFFTPLNIKYLIHDILHRQIPVLHLTDSHPIPDHYNAVRYPDYLLQV